MAAPQTKFAARTNPFTGQSTLKRVDADGISITDDPIPGRRVVSGKYDPLFVKLKPGQCLRVPTSAIGSVSQGLRKWLERHDRAGRIKAARNYEGDPGYGRVWLLGGEK